jgi:hypothetical protein
MEFRFRKTANIGVPQAEQDSRFLSECYIDCGYLDVLLDTQEPRIFVHGRTGAGKTALLMRLQSQRPGQVVLVRPETLALNHVCNSNIIRFFEGVGVRMDPFYKLLWRHALTVELLKSIYGISTPEANKNVWQRLVLKLQNDGGKLRALEYMRTFGDSFWKETDERITEVTTIIEKQLKDSLAIDVAKMVEAGYDDSLKVTESQKQEIVNRCQEVVSKVKLRELNEMLKAIDQYCLTDEQRPFYILIDGLDEDWIEDRLRYRLIKALLEAARDFCEVKNAKVIVAIRRDLMERVFRLTRHHGQQEEKYMALCLQLKWTEHELEQLLDSRMNELVREQYTKQTVTLRALLPSKISKQDPVKYLLQRTFLRPRDAIGFVNKCISACTDKPKFTKDVIMIAEREYSRDRLASICDEWHADFPELVHFTSLLQKRSPSFWIRDVDQGQFDDFCLDFVSMNPKDRNELYQLANSRCNDEVPSAPSICRVFSIFYKVGLVGLRIRMSEGTKWSYLNDSSINSGELSGDSRVYVHPAFWSVLSIRDTG